MTIIKGLAILLADSSPDIHGHLLLSLFIILTAAKILAELFERIGQPAVIGEILAGIIIGPHVLGWVQPSLVTTSMAEIGVIFLLFTVGLETAPSDIFRVGKRSIWVAILGVVFPFLAGWGLLSFWPGYNLIEALFLGAAMVATSVGITARVLAGMNLISAEASRVILAAAVIDDIIGLLVLAVVSSTASGHIDYLHISIITLLAVGFTILIILFGSRVVKKVKKPVSDMRINHSLFLFALLLCFGLASVAGIIGIAGIVGAFLAGVALSEATDDTKLHQQAQTLTEFATPFFLVNIGMQLNLSVFGSRKIILLSVVVTILAILTKLIGCGLAATGMGRKRAWQVGVGMIPRGEVGIVVAQIGLVMAAVQEDIYAVVLVMSVVTTLVAPPLIKLAFSGESPPDQLFAAREEELSRPLE